MGEARNDGKDAFLSGETHAFSTAVRRTLVDKFGLRTFRTNQLQAVNSALLGIFLFRLSLPVLYGTHQLLVLSLIFVFIWSS